MPRRTADVERAYAACDALARSHYENFPVASRLLPASMRPHIAAVYAFARVADDIADEGNLPAADRRAQLDAWGARLHAAADPVDLARRDPPSDLAGLQARRSRDDLIFAALGHSMRTLDLP